MSGNQTVNLQHTSAAVSSASTPVVAENGNRTYILIQNDSDGDIYIKFGSSAVLHEGIMLSANGGHFEASPRFANLDLRAVFAIHEGVGAKTLLVTEG